MGAVHTRKSRGRGPLFKNFNQFRLTLLLGGISFFSSIQAGIAAPLSERALSRLLNLALETPLVRPLLREASETEAIFFRITEMQTETQIRSALEATLSQITRTREALTTSISESLRPRRVADATDLHSRRPNISQAIREISARTGELPRFGWTSIHEITSFERVKNVHRRASMRVYFDLGTLASTHDPLLSRILRELREDQGEIRLMGSIRPDATQRGMFIPLAASAAEFSLENWRPIIRIGADTPPDVLIHELTHARDWKALLARELNRARTESPRSRSPDDVFTLARARALRFWDSAEGSAWTERNAIREQLQALRRSPVEHPSSGLSEGHRTELTPNRQVPYRFENPSFTALINYPEAEALRLLLGHHSLHRLIRDSPVGKHFDLALQLASAITRRALLLERSRFHFSIKPGEHPLEEILSLTREGFINRAVGSGELQRFTAEGTKLDLEELIFWVISEQIQLLPEHHPRDVAFKELLRRTLLR
jgi:hypothetical protein